MAVRAPCGSTARRSRHLFERIRVGGGLVPTNSYDLRDDPLTVAPIEMDQQLQALRDRESDGRIRQLDPGLQDAGRKPGQRLLRRVRMNGGQCARVAGVEGL